jgi:hypothetical protein
MLALLAPVEVDTAHWLVVSLPGRQNDRMSSPAAWVAAVTPVWFQPVRAISQFPAVGVPLPPPTDVAGVRAMTVDCSAGGVRPKAAGWLKVPDHAFGMVIARAEHPPPAC